MNPFLETLRQSKLIYPAGPSPEDFAKAWGLCFTRGRITSDGLFEELPPSIKNLGGELLRLEEVGLKAVQYLKRNPVTNVREVELSLEVPEGVGRNFYVLPGKDLRLLYTRTRTQGKPLPIAVMILPGASPGTEIRTPVPQSVPRNRVYIYSGFGFSSRGYLVDRKCWDFCETARRLNQRRGDGDATDNIRRFLLNSNFPLENTEKPEDSLPAFLTDRCSVESASGEEQTLILNSGLLSGIDPGFLRKLLRAERDEGYPTAEFISNILYFLYLEPAYGLDPGASSLLAIRRGIVDTFQFFPEAEQAGIRTVISIEIPAENLKQ